MFGHRNNVVKKFNEQLHTIRDGSNSTGQETFLSLYTFASYVDAPLFMQTNVNRVQPWNINSYFPSGMTALYDAIGTAVSDMSLVPDADDTDTSFLVVVITDGEENQSRKWGNDRDPAQIKKLMYEKTATDRWTFVFICPPSSVRTIQNLGVPDGNIQPWDLSSVGFERSSAAVSTGYTGYFTARSAGARSSKSFFQTNLTNVSRTELKQNLVDVRNQFVRLPVNQTGPIRPYVESLGYSYSIGNSFYELTKREDVQEQKEIVIEDRVTGAIYAGSHVRDILRLPSYETIRLEPGAHGDYRIFVQSTSVNRKLISGTTMLLKR